MSWEINWTHPANHGAHVMARNLTSHIVESREWKLLTFARLRRAGFHAPILKGSNGHTFREDRVCVECGIDYIAIQRHQKSCSKRCGQIHNQKRLGKYFGGEDRTCIQCNQPYQATTSYQKYCSQGCMHDYHNHTWRGINKTNPHISSGTTGAISELLVAADLMRKGYNVFRALSQSCPCDLVILKDKQLWRVEVTTGYRSASGKLQHVHKPNINGARYDIVAYAVRASDEIVYDPPLPITA